jgi:hypothetical protein
LVVGWGEAQRGVVPPKTRDPAFRE